MLMLAVRFRIGTYDFNDLYKNLKQKKEIEWYADNALLAFDLNSVLCDINYVTKRIDDSHRILSLSFVTRI